MCFHGSFLMFFLISIRGRKRIETVVGCFSCRFLVVFKWFDLCLDVSCLLQRSEGV